MLIRLLLLALLFVAVGIATRSEPPAAPAAPPKVTRQTLPQKCRPLLELAGDEWINCMGVGYK